MAFCAQCGSETQGSFCPSCGAPADAAPRSAPSPSGAALEDHIVHALCYLLMPLTGVLFLVLDPYKTNRGVRFHAFQSILVFAALFVGAQALAILAFTPGLRLIMLVVTLAFPFFAFAVWFYLSLQAFRKERVVVPVLGAIAETQA
jgi:uncharacterized membrane protein